MRGQAQRSSGNTADRCRAVLEAFSGRLLPEDGPDEGRDPDREIVFARYKLKSGHGVHAAMVGGPVQEYGKAVGRAASAFGQRARALSEGVLVARVPAALPDHPSCL